MFHLASTIPDKEILYKSKPKSSILITNVTIAPFKLEKPVKRRVLLNVFSYSTLDLVNCVVTVRKRL